MGFIGITAGRLMENGNCGSKLPSVTKRSARKSWCVVLFCIITANAVLAQTFTSLVSFNGSNGAFPQFILQGRDGNLWGTTSGSGQPNCGNVYKMTPAGILTVVFAFDCTDGNEPQGLTLGTDGNYYGITFFGGANGHGTIFKLTSSGVLTVLYSFGGGSDGSGPLGSLIQGTDGNFYGATYGGGLAASYGTLFKITPAGTLTTLYAFDFTHGAQPYAGLVQGKDGNFYGTTYSGGAYGGGTVFKITPHGTLSVLHSFGQNLSDGDAPIARLIQAKDGNFYSTTPYGGPNNDGTVFKITRSGVLTILHYFVDSDGRYPDCGVVQGTDGNFYGATAYGGTNDPDGTVFKMTPTGTVTTLHNFDGADGANPCSIVQDTSGVFFGTTGGGGDLSCDPSYGCGTLYSLSVGLSPFVETLPTAGKVGTKVTILGTNLTGATVVNFNGTTAAFTVVSSSQITTTVPTGATSGKVRVTTPSGTLSSNVAFRVFP